ncbi:peptidylprolyl isomerase [Psychroflexus planctonicus]|nr:peptidylprolyl isomerase [Psychroflexus planctonicus]
MKKILLMMQFKTMTLKPFNYIGFVLFFLFTLPGFAQVIVDEKDNLIKEQDSVKETPLKVEAKDNKVRLKIDGVAAVVGKYLIIDSDIQKLQLDAKQQDIPESETTSCKMLERIMDSKLFAHHAIQDSLIVSEEMIMSRTEQQIAGLIEQVGTEERILEFYGKEDIDEVKNELYEQNLQRSLAEEMQGSIVDGVEVTPEETRNFFESIPEDEKPYFGDEVEVAQIVIEPQVGEEQIEAVKARLNEFRREVLEEGKAFATRAVLYSEDEGSKKTGGKYTLTRKDQFVKEFKDAAFSLNEGEISKPFKTEFGYHILLVEKIRGQQVDVRHILLYPEVTKEAVDEAKEKAEKIKEAIENGDVEFAEAAREFSNEKETRQNGGQLINSATGDKRFELAKMDTELYSRIYNLDEGEISRVIKDEDRSGKRSFKILTVTKKIEEHQADFTKDYPRIKELALKQKQLKEIERWKSIKVKDTYVKINAEYKECEFAKKWLENLQ